jgi:WD40 repeat protein
VGCKHWVSARCMIAAHLHLIPCIRLCIHFFQGHQSTIRCIKTLHNRPIAVTGSRDTILRVWDIQRKLQLHELRGHQLGIRCLDVCGNHVVSGSYDATCRVGPMQLQTPSFTSNIDPCSCGTPPLVNVCTFFVAILARFTLSRSMVSVLHQLGKT